MCGSGGGGGGPRRPIGPRVPKISGGGGGGPSINQCELIGGSVRLSSPNPDVVDSLRSGDILTLQLTEDSTSVVAVTKAHETAGSVLPSDFSTLVDCMIQDHKYDARVESIKGGICIIKIHYGGRA